MRRRERGFQGWKGPVAGLAGGLAGTLVMTQAQRLMSSGQGDDEEQGAERAGDHDEERAGEQHEQGQSGGDAPATVQVARHVSRAVGKRLSPQREPQAGQAVHYGFGALMGAVYGGLVELHPGFSAGRGAAFGAALFLMADEVAVPALGLSEPPTQQPLGTHAYGLASHLIYGGVAELVRGLVRGALD